MFSFRVALDWGGYILKSQHYEKEVLLSLQVCERMRIDVRALTELRRPEVKSLVLKAHMAERLFKVLFIFLLYILCLQHWQ